MKLPNRNQNNIYPQNNNYPHPLPSLPNVNANGHNGYNNGHQYSNTHILNHRTKNNNLRGLSHGPNNINNINNNRPQSSRTANQPPPPQGYFSNQLNYTGPQWDGNFFQKDFANPMPFGVDNSPMPNPMNPMGNPMIPIPIPMPIGMPMQMPPIPPLQQHKSQPNLGMPQNGFMFQAPPSHITSPMQPPSNIINFGDPTISPPVSNNTTTNNSHVHQGWYGQANGIPNGNGMGNGNMNVTANQSMQNMMNNNDSITTQNQRQRRKPKSQSCKKWVNKSPKRGKTVLHRKQPLKPDTIALPPATREIRTYSLSPKIAEDDRPKDELTLFLIENEIRDIKHKLKENHIGLKQLKDVDADDLKELCQELELSTAEKIRFKCAVKELQRNGSISPHPNGSISPQSNTTPQSNNSAPARTSQNNMNTNMNHSNINFNAYHNTANSGPPVFIPSVQDQFIQNNQQQHQQRMKRLELQNIRSQPIPSHSGRQLRLMQSESQEFTMSPAVAIMEDDYKFDHDQDPNAPKLPLNPDFLSNKSVHKQNITISKPLPRLPTDIDTDTDMDLDMDMNADMEDDALPTIYPSVQVELSGLPELPAFTPNV